MLDIFPYFIMFGVFCFMTWLVSIESDKADSLRKQNAELKREMNNWYNAYLDSESEMWSRISAMQTNIAKRDLMIKELRDCSNQYDQCTVWECNC